MAIRANNLVPAWFTPESEKESDNPARFLLKPLDGEEYLELITELGEKEEGGMTISGKGLKLAIRYGLAGWENFNDAGGTPLKFSRGNIGLLPVYILVDLAQEIANRSAVSGEQEKN